MKITLIAGSNREQASTTLLLRHIERLLRAEGRDTALIELRELPLPLFTPDNWDFHPNARRVADAIGEADGLVLATPEYHGSVSGTLKNALDYVGPDQIAGKPVLSVSSAGGPLGVGALSHLQAIVRGLHGLNCPEWISLGGGFGGFGEDGAPLDEGLRARVASSVGRLTALTRAVTAEAKTAAAN